MTTSGVQGWMLACAQWAQAIQAQVNALPTSSSSNTNTNTTTSADPHRPFTILTADADTTLTDSQVGVVCAEFTAAATHTVTLPAPVQGAWFEVQMRAAGASTGTFKINDQSGNTLMTWTPGGSLAHRWTVCEVQDNAGTLQWTCYIARTWTSDVPPTLS